MIQLALNTYVHLICIIAVFCCLILELRLVKETVSWNTLRLLNKIDGIYGIAAILVVATGLLNWIVFGKGYDYYAGNILFIIKFSLFIVVGLLSIFPTVMFAKLKKRNKEEPPSSLTLLYHDKIRKVIILEIAIMSCIPLLAELMANGIDIT